MQEQTWVLQRRHRCSGEKGRLPLFSSYSARLLWWRSQCLDFSQEAVIYPHSGNQTYIVVAQLYIFPKLYVYTCSSVFTELIWCIYRYIWILKGDRHFKERDVISGRRPECNIHGLAIFVNLIVSELMLRYTNWIRLKLWKLFFSPRFIREKMCRK